MTYKEFVLGFVFDETNENVLLQKSLHPDFKSRWNGIGGKLKHGEASLDAMKRESKEEIGFVPVDEWDFKFTFICPGGTVHVFKAEAPLEVMASLSPQEDPLQETSTWRVDRLPIKKASNLGWIVPMCLEPVSNFTITKTRR